MAEPTIICPKCKTEIKLNESLAAPLIEATRKQFEEQLAQKDSDIATKEQAIRKKEKLIADAQNKLDEQVANQVEEQLKTDRARIAGEEGKIHTSGHASPMDLKLMVSALNPRRVVPIHSFSPERYKELFPSVVQFQDGERWSLDS